MNKEICVHQMSVGPLQVNCYVIHDKQSKEAIVIDPGGDGDRIIKYVLDQELKIIKVINTHGHFDHIGANKHIIDHTGAELLIHADDLQLLKNARAHAEIYGLSVVASPEPDRLLDQGDCFQLGELLCQVFHVPGHSPGGICLLCEGHLFVGDVLFSGSIGRTDLPGGDFESLLRGVREQLFALPDETIVHPGHGPDTTIGRERKINPFVGDDAALN